MGRCVSESPPLRPVATLWQLELQNDRLCCTVYRGESGFYVRVESATAVIVNEPFELQPRMLARAEALRDSLRRRGWQEPS